MRISDWSSDVCTSELGGEPQVAKHLFDDLRDGQVLKNPAIGGAGQQPQPGPQGRLVTGELALVNVLAEARNDAVKMPLAAAVQLQAHAHGFAEHLEIGRASCRERVRQSV